MFSVSGGDSSVVESSVNGGCGVVTEANIATFFYEPKCALCLMAQCDNEKEYDCATLPNDITLLDIFREYIRDPSEAALCPFVKGAAPEVLKAAGVSPNLFINSNSDDSSDSSGSSISGACEGAGVINFDPACGGCVQLLSKTK